MIYDLRFMIYDFIQYWEFTIIFQFNNYTALFENLPAVKRTYCPLPPVRKAE